MQQIDRQRISMSIQKELKEKERRLERINRLEKTIQDSKSSEEVKESRLLRASKMRLETVSDMVELQKSLSGFLDEENKKTDRLLGTWSKISSVIAAVGTAIELGTKTADFLNRQLPGYRDVRAVSLAEDLYRPSERAMRGQSARDIVFAPERAKALKGAVEFGINQEPINQAKYKSRGRWGTALGIGGTILAGAALTGLTAATAGTVIPLTMGLGAMTVGAGKLFGDEGLGYEAVFGDSGEITKKTMQQALERRKQIEAREKAKDIGRTRFLEYITEPGMFSNVLNLKRRSGMSEQRFFEDYFTGGGLQGAEEFVFRERAGMTGRIMAAGGSAGAAFNQNAITALQAQRAYGVTNAGQAMGRLANYMTEKESDDAFKRILSSAFSEGLDDSKKLETYLDTVTSIAQNIGGGQDSVASSIMQMMGESPTVRDIQAAGRAYGSAADIYSEQTGPTAVARARFISKSPLLSGLSGIERQSYQTLRYDQIVADNPEIKRAFDTYKETEEGKKRSDLTVEQYAEELKKGFRESVLEAYKGTELYEEYQKSESLGQRMNLLKVMAPKLMGTDFRARAAFTRGMIGDPVERPKDLMSRERFEELKSANYSMQPELQEKFEAARKFYGYQDAMEGVAAGMGKSQRQLFESPDLNIPGIMRGLADNMSKSLDMHLKERLLLEEFNNALTKGAKEAMNALKEVILKEFPDLGYKLFGEKKNYGGASATQGSHPSLNHTPTKNYTPMKLK
jgi:hypothetical protein